MTIASIKSIFLWAVDVTAAGTRDGGAKLSNPIATEPIFTGCTEQKN
jgi:hypothetical protein